MYTAYEYNTCNVQRKLLPHVVLSIQVARQMQVPACIIKLLIMANQSTEGHAIKRRSAPRIYGPTLLTRMRDVCEAIGPEWPPELRICMLPTGRQGWDYLFIASAPGQKLLGCLECNAHCSLAGPQFLQTYFRNPSHDGCSCVSLTMIQLYCMYASSCPI